MSAPTDVLRTILDQAVRQTSADRGALVEVVGEGELRHRVLYRIREDALEGQAGQISRSICRRVFRTRKSILIRSACEDPLFRTEESVQSLRLTSVLCAPILVGGRLRAIVYLEARRPAHFKQYHLRLLQSLAVVAGPALESIDLVDARQEACEAASLCRQEVAESRELLARDWSFGRFVGRAPVVRVLEESIRQAAETEFPVLLLGETGTGKGILARVLHYSGPRAKQPFVTVFCPSLEPHMVETELFGHRRGAFTDAVRDRIGKVQAAEKGTILLDEVAELPLRIQPKLLRLLEEKTYERVGDPTELHADLRVIACTNRDLDAEVEAGRFRRDLYERLNYIPIRVPPVRERRTDIPALVRHCLDQKPRGRWIAMSPDAERYLVELDFDWPGNVRQIDQLATRLALRHARQRIPQGTLAAEVSGLMRGVSSTTELGERPDDRPDDEVGLHQRLKNEERDVLTQALRRYPDLTRKQLADRLHISEAALYKKLRRHGLTCGR